MSPRLLQLDGPSLEDLKAQVLAEHGTRARVVSVETITTGGIHGFFGHRHYEITVEVDDGVGEPLHYGQVREAQPDRRTDAAQPSASSPPTTAAKSGLDALLEDADGEDTVSYEQREPGFPVSTSSRDFANILDELESVTAPSLVSEPPKPLHVPPLLSAQGDLVVIVGLGIDALHVAHAMALAVGRAEVATSGLLDSPGLARLTDRRDALLARARGVERRETLFVAVGISSGGVHASSQATAIAQLRADQVWAVVDASRKPEDTARWMRKLASVVQVDAVVGTEREATFTPETVATLGLPVTWDYSS